MGRPKTDGGRIDWLDELRTFMIVLVVNMHACVTYSHVGSWYVNEAPEPSLMTKLPFVFWQAHLQSFFMGTLFLVSGYLAHGAIGRRGPAGFARERLFRLGLPTLLYMLVLHPLIVIAINPYGNDYGSKLRAYERFVLHGDFVGSSGPMWFAAALLVFCLVLAAVRGMRGADAAPDGSEPAGPTPRAVLLWLAGLIGATFLTRTVQPLNTSVLNMQLCYFPQYVFAFVTGLAAARGRWLERLAGSPLARRSGWCALVLGTPLLAGVLVFGGVLKGKGLTLLGGGWHLAALAYAAWEQTVGTGLGLGCLALFSTKLNRATPLSKWLSNRSFGVYLFHPVILILVTLALRPLDTDPFFKVAILTALGLAGSFLVADLARRVPGLRALV